MFKTILLLSVVAIPAVAWAQAGDAKYYVYVSVGGEDTIACYDLNPETGTLSPRESVRLAGGPGALCVDAKQEHMYAANRPGGSVATLTIDAKTGKLSPIGSTPVAGNPVYLALDKSGKYLLTAYYADNKAAVYPIDPKGIVEAKATSLFGTAKNPHSIQVDAANQFAYVPSCGDDKVLIYKLTAAGALQPAEPAEVIAKSGAGPRHFWFHPSQPRLYVVNEKNSSVTVYDRDAKSGSLTPIQDISTLPSDFTGSNTCAHIETTPDGKFLYASNRGHDSLAMYKVDGASGKLTAMGNQATEKTPRAFTIDPSGNFLFAAGQGSGKLASYRIDKSAGTLKPLSDYAVGKSPAWVTVLHSPWENEIARPIQSIRPGGADVVSQGR